MAKEHRDVQSHSPKRSGEGSGNTVNRQPRKRGPPSGKSRGDPVWGKLPQRERDQEGLTLLFADQKRLKAALTRQARLAKLDVAEVRSTEAEQLRRINQQIADGIVLGKKGSNPFSKREITSSQRISEDMIRRQGKRMLTTASEYKRPVIEPAINRRRSNLKPVVKDHRFTHEDFLSLRGPLLAAWHRAKVRGYRGPPNRWLKGPAAERAVTRLRQKGIIDPLWTGVLSVFDRHAPLRYAVTACSVSTYQTSCRGFQDEKLYYHPENLSVMVGQARAVKRLPLDHWPRDLSGGRSWPTFPTLNESWEMAMRGKYPVPLSTSDREKLRGQKLPSKQVLPGQMVRTVSNFVIGIRATVAVPRKFLGYFAYRWGFLILKGNRPLPHSLASFLAGQWKSDISGVFLKFPIRYNEALRRMPSDRYLSISGWVKASVPTVKRRRIREPRSLRLLNRARGLSPSSTITQDNESDRGVRLC
jgi:hypothetical protein